MMREIKIKNLTWISVVRPDKSDIDGLKKRFPQIHPLVLEELLISTIRTKVEEYGGDLFMVLHFPDFVQEDKKTVSHELDFILLQDTLISAQYDENKLLENFWHENNDDTIEDQYSRSPIHFLYYLLRGYFFSLTKELDQIQIKIDAMENQVFAEKEKETLKDISILRKTVLDFRRALKPQHITLSSLAEKGVERYGEAVKPFLNDLIGEYLKVWNLLENHKETLDSLYETNNALLSTKMNDIMRLLTLFAFMTFVPMMLAAIFGMGLAGSPLAFRENAFWQALAFMASTTFMIYLILRWKKLV